MLQFYDDLPDYRWAAFLYVERQVRQHHLSGPPSIEKAAQICTDDFRGGL